MLFFLVGSEVTALNAGVEGIGEELAVLLGRHVDSTQLFSRMVDLTIVHIERLIEMEQRRIAPVSKEATIGKRQSLNTTTLDEVILTVIEEVALIELHSHTTPKLHNSISTIVYVGVRHTKVGSLHQVETIGTTTIEVAVLHKILSSTFHTNHATRAISALGMTNRQVMYLTMVAVDEIETVGITGIYLDA